MHAPSWRNGAWLGQLRQCAEVLLEHVEHEGSQLWQSESASAYRPSPQLDTHVEPFLYGVAVAQVVQSEAVPAEQVPHVASHCWQYEFESS